MPPRTSVGGGHRKRQLGVIATGGTRRSATLTGTVMKGSDAGAKPDPTLKDDMIEAWKGRDRESRNYEVKAGGERPRLLIIGAHLPGDPDRATILLPLRHLVAMRTISLITSVIVIVCRGAARKLLLRGTIHRPTGEGALTTPKRKNKHRW